MTPSRVSEDLLRAYAPRVLGVLLRRYGTGQFDLCENAMQEALLAAHEQWPASGTPTEPQAWLVTTARRRLIDQLRADSRRRERERTQAELTHPLAAETPPGTDDSLEVLTLCCHPALSTSAQVALTLRAVAGLTTAQIAHAYLIPEATVAQRISRAKARIRDSGAVFPAPSSPDDRRGPVLSVQYLMFNEGHTATTGDSLYDTDLTREALRLARQIHGAHPDHPEVAGLLSLMLLTDARRAARMSARGCMIPSTSRIVPSGTPTTSPRASRPSVGSCRAAHPPRTCSKPPSPPYTQKPPASMPRTGPRSSPSTNSWNASPPTPWSRSTAP